MSGTDTSKIGLIVEFLSRLGIRETISFEDALSSAALMISQLEESYGYDVDEAVKDFIRHNPGAYDKGFNPSDFLDDYADDKAIEFNEKMFKFELE